MTDSALLRGSGAARWLRVGLVLGLGATLFLLLRDRISGIDLAAVQAAIRAVPPLHWLASFGFVAASFCAVGVQELALHRHFATQAPTGQARRAGMIASAMGQAVGFGPAIGTLIRWHLVPGLGGRQAARLSLAMSLAFLLVLGIACALATGAVPGQGGQTLALVGGVSAVLVILLCAIPPYCVTRHLRLPSLGCLFAFAGGALADLLCLAAAFWFLLPPEAGVSFPSVLPVVLLALGAGLISGMPGGAGAFDLTVLTLLPDVDDAQMIAAALAFRLTAIVIPALIAAIVLLTPPERQRATCPTPALPACPPRAEAGLSRQGVLTLERHGSAPGWLLGRLPHSCVALGDPGPLDTPDARAQALAALSATARAEARFPCVYKTGARMAVTARQSGWTVRRIAAEAWLHPAQFALSGPDRAGLRRKLRRAARAGVSTGAATGPLPLGEMAKVAILWASAHGGERGFSMGRWCPRYVNGQRVFLAWHRGRLIAFLSLHDSPGEWTLDLLRSLPGSPDGTMHALLAAAIDAAREAGIPRLSLAAVPRAPGRHRAGRRPDSGLTRFKTAFAPQWEPLYLCAPSACTLAITAADIARAVLRPAPLASAPPLAHFQSNEIAPAAAAWHRMAVRPTVCQGDLLRKDL